MFFPKYCSVSGSGSIAACRLHSFPYNLHVSPCAKRRAVRLYVRSLDAASADTSLIQTVNLVYGILALIIFVFWYRRVFVLPLPAKETGESDRQPSPADFPFTTSWRSSFWRSACSMSLLLWWTLPPRCIPPGLTAYNELMESTGYSSAFRESDPLFRISGPHCGGNSLPGTDLPLRPLRAALLAGQHLAGAPVRSSAYEYAAGNLRLYRRTDFSALSATGDGGSGTPFCCICFSI